MRANSIVRVVLVFVLAVIFTLLPFTVVHAYTEGCLAGGGTSTGSDATTSRGSGDHSEAGGTIATHSAYAEYSEESYFAGFSLNTNNTGQGIFVGVGIGKRDSSLELVLTMADVSEFNDFLISAKYQFLGETLSRPAIAVGVDAINEIPGQMQTSPYIVASKFFPKVKLPLLVSLGWGSGRFRDNFFGSLAFVLRRHWNFIVEYDGAGGNVGISFGSEVSLWKSFPVVVTLGVQNAFASDEESTFSVGAGIRFH